MKLDTLIEPIAKRLNIRIEQVKNTLSLLEEGNTVPFIARYRKERTGGLDEEQIRIIHEEYEYQVNLKKRKEDVLRLIEQQGKLTDEIVKEIETATKLSQVEDIYRPYQQKRKTRATEAVKKGLQPLADFLLTIPYKADIEKEASKYLSEEVKTVEEALQGAKDILAEKTSDDPKIREKIRNSIENYGKIKTAEKKKHEDEKKVYKMYYDYEERVSTLATHRIMAIDRGEKEKVFTVSFVYDKEYIVKFALRRFTKNRPTCGRNTS